MFLVPTASLQRTQSLRIGAAGDARSLLAALEPLPFPPERERALEALRQALGSAQDVSVIWITDGLDHDGRTAAFAEGLVRLASSGSALAIELGQGEEPLAVAADLGAGGRLEAVVLRAEGREREVRLSALNPRGQRLGEANAIFGATETRTTVRFELPLELRNQISRVEIMGERSAGSVHLLDARSQFHRIGLISGASLEQAQPLLGPLYYLERAMQPFAEIVRSDDANLATALDLMFKRNVSVIALADVGTIPPELRGKVAAWVNKGGVLVRFAGHRLESGGDELLPIVLRSGGRALGGALSWSTPQPLAAMSDDSLFAGLAVPPDVMVTRQVLADPARLGAETNVWARLRDGTPLVTGGQFGEGQLVLFHVTANSEWSNLPLSGLFVEMLRRVASLGRPGGVSDVSIEEAIALQQKPPRSSPHRWFSTAMAPGSRRRRPLSRSRRRGSRKPDRGQRRHPGITALLLVRGHSTSLLLKPN